MKTIRKIVRFLFVFVLLGSLVFFAYQILPDYFAQPDLDLEQVQPYSGSPYVEINGNKPDFDEKDLTSKPYQSYSELDALGRTRTVEAVLDKSMFPTEKRPSMQAIRPSGWHTERYDHLIEDKYLYNRCHLIAYQLGGANEDIRNLITGTRYLNVEGMLPFENEVADYLQYTDHHVIYRVTPIYQGDNLVASGVQMEAMSVEDKGKTLAFNVYCYNVQPGIIIDYSDGESHEESNRSLPQEQVPDQYAYILNTNTKVFHLPNCDSVKDMADHNKEYFDGTKEEAIEKGYTPCHRCNP